MEAFVSVFLLALKLLSTAVVQDSFKYPILKNHRCLWVGSSAAVEIVGQDVT